MRWALSGMAGCFAWSRDWAHSSIWEMAEPGCLPEANRLMKAPRLRFRRPGPRSAARDPHSAGPRGSPAATWSIHPGIPASLRPDGFPTMEPAPGCRALRAGLSGPARERSYALRPLPLRTRPLRGNWTCSGRAGSASKALRTRRQPFCGERPILSRPSSGTGSRPAAQCLRTAGCALTRDAWVCPDARLELLDEPGWQAFDLEDAIQRALEPVVALAGGGSISIEETRAAVVVDVDGGGRKDALALNLEAAETVARELRLRGLGGLVLIDFVDLDRAAERRRVDRRLADGFAGDPAARRHLPFSPLGVIEMTRQRLGLPLAEQWAQRRR